MNAVAGSVPSYRRLAALGAAVAVVLALSACAPSSPIHHSGGPHHSGGSSATPSQTPTPTPTAAAIAPPKVRIPLSCDQLEPGASLDSLLGTTMTSYNAAPDPDLMDYVAIQDGALGCNWTGPTVHGNQSAFWSVLAMPDATATWNTYKTDLGETYPTSYLGAGVYGYCTAEASDPHAQGCNLDMMVGSVWLDIQDQTSAVAGTPSLATLQVSYKPLFAAAIAALKGVTVTEPAWTDPEATATHLPIPADQGAVNQASFSTAIGRSYEIEVSQPQFDLGGAEVAEMLPVGYREDGGGGTADGATTTPTTDWGMTIEVLPSGSWAFAQMSSAASSQPGYATISGLGTQAYMYDAPPTPQGKDDTAIVGIVGQHLYAVEVDDPGAAGNPNTATLAKAAAAYVVKELTP